MPDCCTGRMAVFTLSGAYEEQLHHYLLHYYLLTIVAGCSFTFSLNTELVKPAAEPDA